MSNKKSFAGKAKYITSIKHTKNTKSAIIFASVLFLVTFMLYFTLNNIMPRTENEIINWKFISGKTAADIEGDISSYHLANSQSRVSKQWNTPYIRMQYVTKKADTDLRFVLKTEYNPVSIRLNNKEVLNTGYGQNDFSGSCYNEIVLPAGNENTIDICVYSPLAFDVTAYTQAAHLSVMESFIKYSGFGLGLSILFLGAGLFLFTILLSPKSKHTARMLSLALTIGLTGVIVVLYNFIHTTPFLSSPFWFGVMISLQFLLIILSFITLIECMQKTLKWANILIPVVVVSFILPFFARAWTVLTLAVILTGALIYIFFKVLSVFSGEITSEVPSSGAIKGIFLYVAICQLYNTLSLILGISMISSFVFFGSTFFMCSSTFVVYCKQIIFLDLKKQENTKQLNMDGAWINDIAEFLSKMFTQTNEETFLNSAAQNLADIITKNAYSDCMDIDVHVSVAMKNGALFKEIYNNSNIENCDYNIIYGHLLETDEKILIGNRSVDMLFTSDTNAAVIHFENISCGVTSGLENIIKSAFLNLTVAYKNIIIKNDMTDMQEELFINLATIVEQKDKATQQHQFVVSVLTYQLCLYLGMSEQRAKLISKASMTHDIGKIAVTEGILNKKGKLSDEEYAEMQKHTVFGYNILSVQKGEFFEEASKIAQQHHENFDGSGYYGIEGRSIAPSARVVHLIDVLDALLSKRSYKESWNKEDVVNYITSNRGTMFDPTVVDVFLKCADSLFELREKVIMEGTK